MSGDEKSRLPCYKGKSARTREEERERERSSRSYSAKVRDYIFHFCRRIGQTFLDRGMPCSPRREERRIYSRNSCESAAFIRVRPARIAGKSRKCAGSREKCDTFVSSGENRPSGRGFFPPPPARDSVSLVAKEHLVRSSPFAGVKS